MMAPPTASSSMDAQNSTSTGRSAGSSTSSSGAVDLTPAGGQRYGSEAGERMATQARGGRTRVRARRGAGATATRISLRGRVVPGVVCVAMAAAYVTQRQRLGRGGAPNWGPVGRAVAAAVAAARRTIGLLAGGARGLATSSSGAQSASGLDQAAGAEEACRVIRLPLPPRMAPQGQVGEVAASMLADGPAPSDTEEQTSAQPALEAAAAGTHEPEPPLEVHVVDLRRLTPAAAAAVLAGFPHGSDPRVGGSGAGGAGPAGAVYDGEPVVGLDAEWEPELAPGVRHRVSVVQISTASRCWLLHTGGGVASSTAAAPHATLPHAGQQQPSAASGPPGSCGAVAAPAMVAAVTPAAAAAAPGPVGGAVLQLPAAVVALLQDPRVIKAGVGIQEDVRRLERDFGVRVRSALDVRLAAQRVAPTALAGGGSLAALTGALLGRALDKGPQRSHWGAAALEERQIAYAAHDAWLSRELLLTLHRMAGEREGEGGSAGAAQAAEGANSLGQQQPRPDTHPHHQQQQGRETGPGAACGPVRAEEPGAGCEAGASLLAFAAPYLDTFGGLRKAKAKPGGANGAANGNGARQAGAEGAAVAGAPDGGRAGRKADRKLPTRKSVLYENCRLLAPDGAVLCTCGAKKVRWYVERGLASVVATQPVTVVQLAFEPRGRGHADDQYYLADKENRCCACGSTGEYLRHSVVPHCYRQHFPPEMKSHLSHDIVLLCPPCHKSCSFADQARMEALGALHSAPLGAATAARFRTDTAMGAVRSAARALANKKVVIPPARRAALEALVAAHFRLPAGAALEPAHVAAAAALDPRTEDENWRSHAEVVVAALGGRSGLEAFVRGWRRHFLDALSPRFLPPHWRVDARVCNSAGAEGGGGGREGAEAEEAGREGRKEAARNAEQDRQAAEEEEEEEEQGQEEWEDEEEEEETAGEETAGEE